MGGSLGIFWIEMKTKRIFSAKIHLRDAITQASAESAIVICKVNHRSAWPEASERIPAWKGISDYKLVPRGRIRWIRKSETFAISMNPLLQEFEGLVTEEFGLDGKQCRFIYDAPGYATSDEQLEDLFREKNASRNGDNGARRGK